MAVQWTKEQQQVIILRNANILVSAAAGSGKTAVLVQRIIEKIMDESNPVNIDQLVIVTFTQAAAGEMRERIGAAIEKYAALYPGNEHLQRQRTRIHMANISTIHSFCKSVIQNHFQEIGLEPAFRIGDEGELKLLRKEVIAQVLEQYYAQEDTQFYRLVETFSNARSDERIEELVLKLYDFSMSYPNPAKWLEQCVSEYRAYTYEQWMQTAWMQQLFEHLLLQLDYVEEKLLLVWELLAEREGETFAYREIFQCYETAVHDMKQEVDYRRWQEILSQLNPPALPRGKKSCPDVFVREKIKAYRDAIKNVLDKMLADYFGQKDEEIILELEENGVLASKLAEVTQCFADQFREAKRQKNLLDFSDLEHETLRILLGQDGMPTETAKEYAEFFDEILIDEYQDSNLVQEYLLNSISKQSVGKNNLFMVGDCKQSIYRFRLARPELFMEKFHTYSVTDGDCRRIDLHKNFRSRREVLDGVNYICSRLMQETLGGIAYDKEAALYPGMEYEYPQKESSYCTELMLYSEKEKEVEVSSLQYEAKLIAHRIKQLVSKREGLLVRDKQSGIYRTAQYRDIAILLRSMGGFDSVLIEELAAEGIPAHTVSRSGYFDTLEIATILNYLRIVDNPRQDIALVAVLKSPFVGIEDEALAKIRTSSDAYQLYDCVCSYVEHGKEEVLKNKLSEFLLQLEQFRKAMCYMPIHKFLCHMLEVTGYEQYVRMMPGGLQRSANIEMLIEKASAFEQTSYLGVFQFIRYIEQLRKYEIDAGEASTVSEHDNTVRIMTIHKSKGLEFPIVFVAGLGRKFNNMESRQEIVMHPELGIGIDYVDVEKRRKSRTLIKKTILLRNRLETYGEELRVLYVALTRAKEKLILCGGVDHIENSIRSAYEEGFLKAPSYTYLTMANSYMEWILAAIIGHKDVYSMVEQYVEQPESCCFCPDYSEAYFQVEEKTLETVVNEDLQELAVEAREELMFDKEKEHTKENLPECVIQALEYTYEYEAEQNIPAKVSVSELKHAQMQLEEGKQLFSQQADEPLIPCFMQENTVQVSATSRGTAYHKVMECLDFTQADSFEQIKQQLEELFNKGILEEKMRQVIRPQKLWRFVSSDIGTRMKQAARLGRLYREQPFVYAMPAIELDEQWKSEEPVLIQGIVDAFFEEDGAIVLVDYKTDYVPEDGSRILRQRYGAQMKYYKQALQDMLQMPVKACILYSVYMDTEVHLTDDKKSL